MTIHELADRFGISPRTINTWRVRHGFPPPYGGKRGPTARYGVEHVEWIQAWQRLHHHFVSGSAAVAHCREEGITLAEYLRRRDGAVRVHGIGVG